MPCPANPQPPGFFDLAAPHSSDALWILGSFGGLLLLMAGLVWLVMRSIRRRMPPSHRRSTSLLVLGTTFCCLAVSLLLAMFDGLWETALLQWFLPFQGHGCAAINEQWINETHLVATLGYVAIFIGFASFFMGRLVSKMLYLLQSPWRATP